MGRGRGFAVHKALDQVGAFAGPLLVAGVIALTTHTWAGLAVLAVPGAVAMVLLFVIRERVPDMSVYDGPAGPVAHGAAAPAPPGGCPATSNCSRSRARRAPWA